MGLHAAVLLGLAAAAFHRYFPADGGGESADFTCSVGEAGTRVSVLTQISDIRGGTTPAPEPPPVLLDASINDAYGLPRWGVAEWVTLYYEEGEGWCGTCLSLIYKEHGGRVRWVRIPKPPLVREPGAYFVRQQAPSNRRQPLSGPRLPRSRELMHRLGLEVVCRCPDYAFSPLLSGSR